jgi:hypothetical protein
MIYAPTASVFDSDAYGVSTDSPDTWADNFYPRKKDCEEAQEKYTQAMYEVLDDIADDLGLDTSEWGKDDYWEFKEIVGL